MKKVRIIKDYPIVGDSNRRKLPENHPDIMRQTPGCRGIWEDVQFTLSPAEKSDYVIVLNYSPRDVTVKCPKNHVWAVIQEPPPKMLHKRDSTYSRVYTVDAGVRGERYFHGQTVLPWHVEKDYDFLINCKPPEKTRKLSWVVSDYVEIKGHYDRLGFLGKIRKEIDFDLFGRGYNYIEDKWDALAPYKYSLAVENFSNPHYWTEKIADCFLSWTMPIYYGCTRIAEYFPPGAMVCIDINDPAAIDKIREVIEGDLWLKNRDAIACARELVLNKYQLFPFIANEIKNYESQVDLTNISYDDIRIRYLRIEKVRKSLVATKTRVRRFVSGKSADNDFKQLDERNSRPFVKPHQLQHNY